MPMRDDSKNQRRRQAIQIQISQIQKYHLFLRIIDHSYQVFATGKKACPTGEKNHTYARAL
jgi:hypothetical protein